MKNIINFQESTDKHKQQKSELKYKIATALTTMAIGTTAAVTSFSSEKTDNIVPDANVESTVEQDNNSIHEEAGELFAKKLNMETGVELSMDPASEIVSDTNQQVENAFTSTQKEDLLSNKLDAKFEDLDQQNFDRIKNEILEEGVKNK